MKMSFRIRLVLGILACHRLAQLVALDDGPLFVFKRLRAAAGRRAAAGGIFWSSLAEGIHCPYCLGMWFAVPVAALVARITMGGDLILLWLGIAGGQSALEEVGRRK